MMDIEIKFSFYLAAVVGFALAAFADRFSARVRLLPSLWDTGRGVLN